MILVIGVAHDRARHEGRAYDLSGPAALSCHDAAAILPETLGRKIRYVPTEDADFRQRLEAAGLAGDFIDALVEANREARGADQ